MSTSGGDQDQLIWWWASLDPVETLVLKMGDGNGFLNLAISCAAMPACHPCIGQYHEHFHALVPHITLLAGNMRFITKIFTS